MSPSGWGILQTGWSVPRQGLRPLFSRCPVLHLLHAAGSSFPTPMESASPPSSSRLDPFAVSSTIFHGSLLVFARAQTTGQGSVESDSSWADSPLCCGMSFSPCYTIPPFDDESYCAFFDVSFLHFKGKISLRIPYLHESASAIFVQHNDPPALFTLIRPLWAGSFCDVLFCPILLSIHPDIIVRSISLRMPSFMVLYSLPLEQPTLGSVLRRASPYQSSRV